MFLRNQTSYDVRLTKGHIDEEHGVAAVLVEVVYRDVDGRLERVELPPDREPTDPPDTTPFVLWQGVSVTASGTAYGPAHAPFVQPAFLRVGDAIARIIVFGPRRWVPGAGGLVASPAEAFESLPVTFAHAFGGAFEVPPGVIPETDLPHPGYRDAYPLNSGGIGYYDTEARARGGDLPRIERPDQLVKSFRDRPEPGGFSPCRELEGLRMRATLERLAANPPPQAAMFDFDPKSAMRLHHHAVPELIFDAIVPRTPIELNGLGLRAMRLELPASPIATTVRGRTGAYEVAPTLRFVHLDADRGLIRAEYQHLFTYDPRRAPSSIRVVAERSAP